MINAAGVSKNVSNPLMRVDALQKLSVMNTLIELIKYASANTTGCLVGSAPLIEYGGQE
ncbi:hypothetical protein [Nonomuraea candida]|uniref:hypothetical protein n=1 Tax=Nonomuraea candida TaxID=359159 RepID=UPI0012FA7ECF|nr:hypothetical protein [Nonomuraea candida]